MITTTTGELRAAHNDPSEEMGATRRRTSLMEGDIPGPGRRGGTHSWTNEDMDHMLQNTLVVVIGTGEKASTLAERRVQEKGRLLVLLTDRPPARTYDNDGEFAWFPPIRKPPVGEQARQMVHWLN